MFQLPSLLTLFKKSHPKVELSLRTANRGRIEEMVLSSNFEIALVSGMVGSPQLAVEPFRQEKLSFFVSRVHSLAKRKQLLLSDLDRIPLVIRGSHGIKGTTEDILQEIMPRGIRPNIVLRCDSPEAVKTAVRKKAGLGILWRSVLEPDGQKGEFKIMRLKGLALSTGSFIVYQKDQPLSPAAREFLTLLRRYCQKPQTIQTT